MKKNKISLIINIIIVVLVVIGCIFMFTGFKFMPSDNKLEVSNIEMFKFYTVDSNIFMAIVSMTYVFFQFKLNKKAINEIPIYVYILKFVGTSAIFLTFITTAFFLTPQYGLYAMYNNNNLLFHLIVPILSIVSYVFFDKYNNKYRDALFGIIPMSIYSIFYTSNVLLHLKDNKVSYDYDFYGFLQGDLNNIFLAIPIVFFSAYLISILLVFLNKKLIDD